MLSELLGFFLHRIECANGSVVARAEGFYLNQPLFLIEIEALQRTREVFGDTGFVWMGDKLARPVD